MWLPVFLESCRLQEGYEWILVGEQRVPYDLPENVSFVEMTLGEIEGRIEACGFPVPKEFIPYKFCDYKPAYGLIFSDLLEGAKFWGHGDLDLVYGRLSERVNEAFLEGVDVFSADDRSCGHFQIYRNQENVNSLIFQIDGLDEFLRLRSTLGLDEPEMSMALAKAERENGLKWRRAKSRRLELAEKRPLMGATIEPDTSLDGQESTGAHEYHWVHGRAEQRLLETGEVRCELLYLHWVRWKDEQQWQKLMTGEEWREKGLVLKSSDWARPRGGLKRHVRGVIYSFLRIIDVCARGSLREFNMIDKAVSYVMREHAEKRWARLIQD